MKSLGLEGVSDVKWEKAASRGGFKNGPRLVNKVVLAPLREHVCRLSDYMAG